MNKTLKDVLFVVGSLILGFILITVIVLAFYLPRYFLDNTKVGLAEEETEEITVMSKALGSLHYKICVYVILKEISTGKEFIVFNTHPDNQSDEARVNGIKVVLDKIAEFGDLPSFLMDDLNAEPDSVTIASALENFDDSARLAGVSEDAPTFHGWGEEAES